MQIFPNIYLLSGFAYQIHQNVYGIDIPGENKMVLIDCGLGQDDLNMIEQNKILWGIQNREIDAVFITHSHYDHAGNAAYFEKMGCRIYAGEDADSLISGDEHTIGFAYGREFPVCEKVHKLQDGECLPLAEDCKIVCHHTPGHTSGSMCYELICKGMKSIFTGDFVQAGENVGEVRLGVKVDSGYNYSQYVSSMRKMMESEADAVFPGHYEPWLAEGKRIFQLAYRELLVNRERYCP